MESAVTDTQNFVVFVKNYQSIIAAVISVTIIVIGWIINHKLTLKAQRENLLNQLYNTARLDITTSLRIYIKSLQNLMIANTSFDPQNQDKKPMLDDLNKFMKEENTWKYTLEEYQTLIPELELPFKELKESNVEINEITWSIYLIVDGRSSLDNIYNLGDRQLFVIGYQIRLINDLIVYVQNICFSQITGNSMPKNSKKISRLEFIAK